jgi:7,8-dihydro-6-hydroxymethylpterin-pyrophosphokinase
MMRYLCAIGSNVDAKANVGRAISAMLFPSRLLAITRIVVSKREGREPGRDYLCAMACFFNNETREENQQRLKEIEHFLQQRHWWDHEADAKNTALIPVEIDMLAVGRWYLHAVSGSHPHLAILKNDFSPGHELTPAEAISVPLPWGATAGERPTLLKQLPVTGEIQDLGELPERMVNGLYRLDTDTA